MYIHSIFSALPTNIHESGGYRKMNNPDFSDIFEKNEMRRLSSLIKNGSGCGIKAYQNSGFTSLDAIITGTGKGSISKIEQFLKDIETYKETALNPGIFIQSTHNTINGQIALKLNVNTYNMTHVNQGYTWDNVLTDASLILSENKEANVLAGLFEENTSFNLDIHDKSGLSGNLKNGSYDIIWGEGVIFFTLNNKHEGALGQIALSHTFDNLSGRDHWNDINDFVEDQAYNEKTLFLLGYNNEGEKSGIYGSLIDNLQKQSIAIISFKEISGEFDTSTSQAFEMAINFLKDTNQYEKVVICNHFKDYVTHYLEITRP